MQDVAIITCSAARGLDSDMPELTSALEQVSLSFALVDWHDEDAHLSVFRCAVLRSPWDYSQRFTEFCGWLERASKLTRLFNPRDVLHWNLDKRYLRELHERGLPVVPTGFFEPGQPVTLPTASEWVVKPVVSAGSRNTIRHTTADAAHAHALKLHEAGIAVMVQPYLASVDMRGETGMLFVDGRFSHAIRKGPLLAPDAAAISELFAAEHILARKPEADEFRVAEAVLAALPFAEVPLYARVDLLRDDSGEQVLLELELAEPSMFFSTAAGSALRFAQALAARLGGCNRLEPFG